MTSRATIPTGRSFAMTRSSTPAPSPAAIAAACLPQVVPAAAGDIGDQPLFDVGKPSGQAHDPQRQPERLLHGLWLGRKCL